MAQRHGLPFPGLLAKGLTPAGNIFQTFGSAGLELGLTDGSHWWGWGLRLVTTGSGQWGSLSSCSASDHLGPQPPCLLAAPAPAPLTEPPGPWEYGLRLGLQLGSSVLLLQGSGLSYHFLGDFSAFPSGVQPTPCMKFSPFQLLRGLSVSLGGSRQIQRCWAAGAS